MRPSPVRSAATLVVAYAVLTAAAFLAGDRCLRAWLPVLGAEIDWLMPAELVRRTLSLTIADASPQIVLDVATTLEVRGPRENIPTGTLVRSTTLQAYALQHVVIVFAILTAWPATTLRSRGWLLALGVPCALLSASLDIPFALVGLIKNLWLQTVSPAALDTDPFVIYFGFLQRGGRLGLAVAVAVAGALTVPNPSPRTAAK